MILKKKHDFRILPLRNNQPLSIYLTIQKTHFPPHFRVTIVYTLSLLSLSTQYFVAYFITNHKHKELARFGSILLIKNFAKKQKKNILALLKIVKWTKKRKEKVKKVLLNHKINKKKANFFFLLSQIHILSLRVLLFF